MTEKVVGQSSDSAPPEWTKKEGDTKQAGSSRPGVNQAASPQATLTGSGDCLGEDEGLDSEADVGSIGDEYSQSQSALPQAEPPGG
eukprot:CAMPEP_0184297830 /NCGR_PEP_ID=MMETSP1049-20130417/8706_1 /TAXON_ID=77928 /ORGANISM="Proteomonas sulcata, Strain CCMP704" /LENGTH=85 /DNA_ID=CAMNT_0026607735 /DNA_START=36 /DNA_END=292 /DNA_ORIENTATION=-